MSRLVTLLLLAGLLVPRGALAQRAAEACASPSAEETTRLARLLRGHEHVPPPRWWKRQQRCTAVTLVALAKDARRPVFVRMRALWALRFFPGRTASAHLLAVVSAGRLPAPAMRTALGSLARLQGSRAEDALRKRLSDARPTVRVAAARALLLLGTTSARDAVRRARRHERDPGVRYRMHQMLFGVR